MKNVLIIGAGHAGTDLHFPAYKFNSNTTVGAFCDVSLEALELASRKCNVPTIFTDLDKALESIEPDIVSITTPPQTHYGIVKKVLAPNRLVFVEKPIFSNLKEAYEIIELEKTLGGKVVPIHNKLSFPAVQEAQKLYHGGFIGASVHFNAYWMVSGFTNHMTKNPNHWSHQLEGGRWQELISHPIYVAYKFVGRMALKHVTLLRTDQCFAWMPGDEVLVILAGEKSTVSIKLSANVDVDSVFFEVIGKKNTLRFGRLKINADEAREDVNAQEIPSLSARIKEFRTKSIKNDQVDAGKHFNYIKLVLDAHYNNDELPVSWDEALNTLELSIQIGSEIGKLWNKKPNK